MSSSFKSLARRLFTDSEYRSAFLKSPEAAIGDAPLSVDERRALLRLHARLSASEAGGRGLMSAGPLTYWP